MPRKKRPSIAQPFLLSVPDAAIQLGVCRATVYNLIYRRQIPYLKVGSTIRFNPMSLQNWMKQQESV
jgi:excisionase family DNA binding protein